MSARDAGHTCWIAEPFDAGLKRLRTALADARLCVLGEFDVSGSVGGNAAGAARILYVDAPLLIFEALALDRRPAVFMPLHVVIAGDGTRTRVCWADPAAMLGARLPAGAAAPMRELQARLAGAISAMEQIRAKPQPYWPPRQSVRERAMALRRGAAHYV